MRNLSWLILILGLFSGCVKPHYEQQYVEVPEDWRIESDEGSTFCNARWWEEFGDPILDGLISTALKNNQDIHVAIARVIQFYDHYKVVSASLYPFVTANGSYNRVQSSTQVPFSSGDGFPRILNNYYATLNLSWELDFWGKIRSASEAARAQMMAQVNARRALIVSIVASVANAYLVLRQLDTQLKISKETLQSRLESLKLSESRFKLGETSELEVWQSKSLVEDAAIRVLVFERQIPIQENLLSILIGEPPQFIERGETLDHLHYPISIPAGLPSDLLSRRPDIMQAEYDMIAANALVAEARALYFPQMNLTSFLGNESVFLTTFLSGPAQIWGYGIAAVQAIYNSGQIYYTVEEAKALRDESLFAYRQVILHAFQEVNDALVAVKKNKELVAEYAKQVEALSQYFRLATLRFLEGEVDYLNVLDAERQLFAAQLAQTEAEADQYTAIVDLYKALGGGWVIDADETALHDCCNY